MKQALPVPPGAAAPKIVHMNFRVFFAQLELLQGGGSEAGAGDDAAEFYTAMEHEACAQADQVVALTSADASCLAALFPSAPAPAADSLMALRSTCVEPQGTQIKTLGLGRKNFDT